MTHDELKEIERAAKAEARDAKAFAEISPLPSPEEITRHVYWEIDNRPDKAHGRHFFDS